MRNALYCIDPTDVIESFPKEKNPYKTRARAPLFEGEKNEKQKAANIWEYPLSQIRYPLHVDRGSGKSDQGDSGQQFESKDR